jgi:hypothetical protein
MIILPKEITKNVIGKTLILNLHFTIYKCHGACIRMESGSSGRSTTDCYKIEGYDKEFSGLERVFISFFREGRNV